MATEKKPAISIDLKKGRIRIHKKTLRMMGSPDYLQLLINPKDRVIAIQRIEKPIGQFIKVNWEALSRRNSLEVHLTNFLDKVRSCCKSLPQDRTYRIDGKYIAEHELARFCLSDAVLVNYDQEGSNE